MHNWIYVHSFCQSYRDLGLLDKTSKEFEEKSYRLKTFKFLSNELTLDLRITALTFFLCSVSWNARGKWNTCHVSILTQKNLSEI